MRFEREWTSGVKVGHLKFRCRPGFRRAGVSVIPAPLSWTIYWALRTYAGRVSIKALSARVQIGPFRNKRLGGSSIQTSSPTLYQVRNESS